MGAYETSRASQRPKAGTIADGLTTDVDWWNSDSTLSAIWNTFTDNAALTYEFAIGTSTNALADVVDWTSNSADTSVTKTGLSLTDGSTYYVSVRATDTDSQLSDTTTTDGITIDVTSPVISGVIEGSLTADMDYQNIASQLIISWSGSDGGSGITTYENALGTTSGGTETIDWTSTGTTTADT